MIPVQGEGSITDVASYTGVGTVHTERVNNDGTLTPIVNITAVSDLYGVQFTFTITEATWQTDGGPPATALKTEQVNAVCQHDHVQGFYTEQDQGPDQIIYNYGVVTVGTTDGAYQGQVRVRMDHLNDPATFALIDKEWARQQALGAV